MSAAWGQGNVVAGNAATSGSAAASGSATPRDSPPAQGGPTIIADPQTELRPFLSGTASAAQWFASTDPQHRNEDYLLLKPGETRRVPLVAGRLLRLWNTALRPDKLRLVLNTGAGQSQNVTLLDNNRAQLGALHEKAYTLYPVLYGAKQVSILGQGAALVITNRDSQPNKVFYQVAVGPSNSPPESKNPSTGISTTQLSGIKIAPGETKQITKQSGIGYIWRMTLTATQGGLESLLTTRLQARWDADSAAQMGADSTAQPFDVDVPLSALLGVLRTPQPTQNALAQLSGNQLTVTWPMPYASGAIVSLKNTSNQPVEYGVKIQVSSTVRPLSPYRFHAALGSARSQKGQPIQMLQAKGVGFFAGLALDMRPAADSAARSFAYLEGNETITADGKKYEGTGTEDFFNSAWYFPEQAFAQPYSGVTYKAASPPQVTAYRWMVPDAVPFKQNFDFSFEHGNGNSRNDIEYRWAAFWYQAPGGTATVPNTLGESGSGTAEASGSASENSASGETQTDGKFLLIIFAVLMGGVAFFLVRHNVRQRSR